MQSKTYLYCAVRPELQYQNFTFSTLNFAEAASVVEVKPKKVMGEMSPREKKLMEELMELKALIKTMQESGQGGGEEAVGMLVAKQAEMQNLLSEEESAAQLAKMDATRQENGRRGIMMIEDAKDAGRSNPFLLNLDLDPFRDRRFVYEIKADQVDSAIPINLRPSPPNLDPKLRPSLSL